VANACRIGGPSASPDAYIEFPTEAGDASEQTPAATESGMDDASEAASGPDALSIADAPLDATTATDASAGEGGDAACTLPASIPVCNPLTNTGCILSQCDIDTTKSTPTGVCVLASPFPNDAGSACTQVSGSVSCQPQFTCSGGLCSQVCFCNSDCPAGSCCSGTVAATGFGLCGACH
jgi:hypothetical protein